MFSEEKKSNFCGLIHLSRKVRTAALASTILPLHQFLFRTAHTHVWHPGRNGMTGFRRNCRLSAAVTTALQLKALTPIQTHSKSPGLHRG